MPRNDTIEQELVARHLRDYVNTYDGGTYAAMDSLALRLGISDTKLVKLHKGTVTYAYRNKDGSYVRRSSKISFDFADRLFCAMGAPNLWYQDPELQKEYQRVVPEADRRAPLRVAA